VDTGAFVQEQQSQAYSVETDQNWYSDGVEDDTVFLRLFGMR